MLVDGVRVGVGLSTEGVDVTELTVAVGGQLVLRPLPLLPGLGVGQLEQPVGVPLGLGGQVTGLFLGHPEDLLCPATQVVEVGVCPVLGAGEIVAQLAVLVDQPLDLTVEVTQSGLDGTDGSVHGVAVVAAPVDREVAGGEGRA